MKTTRRALLASLLLFQGCITSSRAAAGEPAALADLPLVEAPAARPGDLLAVFLSGDGGWASLDRGVTEELNDRGIAVVGLSSRKYFWQARTPDGAARDLEKILRHYLAAWGRRKILLIGYSFGADALPFLASRLPADLARQVSLVALIGPSLKASFEVHLMSWLGGEGDHPVLPEVEKLRGHRIVCLYGLEEKESLCPRLPREQGRSIGLAGGHHFDSDYGSVGNEILGALP